MYSTVKIYSSYSSNSVLYYNGNAKSFTYYNINKDDVFSEFKDLIPGDVKSQTINIRVGDIKPNTKMYLKLNSDINDDILEKINISFFAEDNLLNIKDDMVYVYTFDSDVSINLKVVIEVPISVDNIISDVSSLINWTFMIEEDGEIIEPPKTYDNFDFKLYFCLIIFSLFMIIILSFSVRKKSA